MDLDQTAPDLSTLSVKKLLNNFSRRTKQTTFDVIGALRVK